LYKQLTARWQKVQSDADIWLAELTVGNSKKRVANLLLYLASKNVDNSVLLPTREDIGALLAITTETASRITAEFKRLGYIQKLENNIIQIDKASLEDL
jgi:CRP-like cAMP-binding protein